MVPRGNGKGQYHTGNIIRDVAWPDWVRTRKSDSLSPGERPGVQFLADLQLLLEQMDEESGRRFDLINQPDHWQHLQFEFLPGTPVSFAQIVDDLELWPIGCGVVLSCYPDGRACAFLRGQDGVVRRYTQSEIFFSGVRIKVTDPAVALSGTFAHLGTLSGAFNDLDAVMRTEAAAFRDPMTSIPRPIVNPILVVCASSGPILAVDGIMLPEIPVVIRDAETWATLQRLARAASWRLKGIFVCGLDAQRVLKYDCGPAREDRGHLMGMSLVFSR